MTSQSFSPSTQHPPLFLSTLTLQALPLFLNFGSVEVLVLCAIFYKSTIYNPTRIHSQKMATKSNELDAQKMATKSNELDAQKMATKSNQKDAPGFGLTPICWKCKGAKQLIKKLSKKRKRSSTTTTATTSTNLPNQQPTTTLVDCTVCKGVGRLAVKSKELHGAHQPGKITKLRQRPSNWNHRGTQPVGNPQSLQHLDPHNGEELTGLVGDWRIFQRVGGHRWSTEDICTAWYAQLVCSDMNINPKNMLDLGW